MTVANRTTATRWSTRGYFRKAQALATTGELQQQHHASLLESGNILVFDNGTRRKRSRLVEVDPRQAKIAWSHTAPGVFTAFRGAAQRLPNGNVLATLSDSGHVVEVTRDGKVVWEYWNPVIRQGPKPERDAMYRVKRYARSYVLPLNSAKPRTPAKR